MKKDEGFILKPVSPEKRKKPNKNKKVPVIKEQAVGEEVLADIPHCLTDKEKAEVLAISEYVNGSPTPNIDAANMLNDAKLGGGRKFTNEKVSSVKSAAKKRNRTKELTLSRTHTPEEIEIIRAKIKQDDEERYAIYQSLHEQGITIAHKKMEILAENEEELSKTKLSEISSFLRAMSESQERVITRINSDAIGGGAKNQTVNLFLGNSSTPEAVNELLNDARKLMNAQNAIEVQGEVVDE